MKIGPVTIFERLRSAAGQRYGCMIAAYHPRDSITWRFVAWWRPRHNAASGTGWVYRQHNSGKHVQADFGFLGLVGFDTQRRIEDIRAIVS